MAFATKWALTGTGMAPGMAPEPMPRPSPPRSIAARPAAPVPTKDRAS